MYQVSCQLLLDDGKKGQWKNLFNHSLQTLGGKMAFINNLNKKIFTSKNDQR